MHNPCKNTIHAEVNAIDWALKHLGTIPSGCTLYVTDSPCIECAKEIELWGITRVVYDRDYRLTAGLDHLRKFKVEITQCHAAIAISVN